MIYSVVTGFYPSKITAEKICQKIKGKGFSCSVKESGVGFSCILYGSIFYEKAEMTMQEMIKNGICCGVCVE